MLAIKEINYKNYGRCVEISNGKIELIVTIDIGPRIISLCTCGGKNLMFNDLERQSYNDVSSVYGEGKVWYIYGGHRVWISPEEHPLTYYPDNNKVVYAVSDGKAVFRPMVQDVTGYQIELAIKMSETEPSVEIEHVLSNMSSTQKEGAIWGLSVMDQNGVVFMPYAKEDTGLLANRFLSIWPYTDMKDDRLFFDSDFVAIRQNPNTDKKVKIGMNNTSGRLAYFNHDTLFIKDYEHIPGAIYPDNGVSSEIYTDNRIIEVESLSPLYKIAPGESITHIERWTLMEEIKTPSFESESLKAAMELLAK